MHKDQKELLTGINEAKKKVEVGARYSHYKNPNQFYTVLAVGIMEATEEVCVIYRAEYGEKITWVRALGDFLAKVTLKDGTKVARFTKVS